MTSILIHILVDYWIHYYISHISYSIFIDPCKETKGSHGSTIGQLRVAEDTFSNRIGLHVLL